MPRSLTLLLAAAALALPTLARASALPIDLDYSNRPGAKIQFDGHSHFTFTTATNNFQITSLGDTLGLLGEMTGTFTIGAITTVGPISTAPVTGTGTFVIHDGAGYDLSAALSWLDIAQTGAFGGLNTVAGVNLTGITYSGANATLLALASSPSNATNTLTFQFVPSRTLSKLKTAKASTSFSGSVHALRVPDSGAMLGMLTMTLLSCAAAARKLRYV